EKRIREDPERAETEGSVHGQALQVNAASCHEGTSKCGEELIVQSSLSGHGRPLRGPGAGPRCREAVSRPGVRAARSGGQRGRVLSSKDGGASSHKIALRRFVADTKGHARVDLRT